MVPSVNAPGRTSFYLSIKRLLPVDGKTILNITCETKQEHINNTSVQADLEQNVIQRF
jgi:hypothetical protein